MENLNDHRLDLEDDEFTCPKCGNERFYVVYSWHFNLLPYNLYLCKNCNYTEKI